MSVCQSASHTVISHPVMIYDTFHHNSYAMSSSSSSSSGKEEKRDASDAAKYRATAHLFRESLHNSVMSYSVEQRKFVSSQGAAYDCTTIYRPTVESLRSRLRGALEAHSIGLIKDHIYQADTTLMELECEALRGSLDNLEKQFGKPKPLISEFLPRVQAKLDEANAIISQMVGLPEIATEGALNKMLMARDRYQAEIERLKKTQIGLVLQGDLKRRSDRLEEERGV